MKKKKKKKAQKHFYNKRWWKYLIAIFFGLVLLFFAYTYIYYIYYADKFYPGFEIGNYSLEGQSYNQVLSRLNQFEEVINEQGLKYKYNEKEIAVRPNISSTEDPDFVYKIIDFENKKTVNEVYEFARGENYLDNFLKHLAAFFNGLEIKIAYELNEEELISILENNFSEFETPAQKAQLKLNEEDSFEKIPEKEGDIFSYSLLVKQTKKSIENLKNEIHYLYLKKDTPDIKLNQTDQAFNDIEDVLNLFPASLTYQDKKWEIKKEDVKKYLDFDIREDQVKLGLKKEFKNYLKDNITDEVNQAVKEGKFNMENGKVSEFQASQKGLSLNNEKTIEKIEKEIIDSQKRQTALVVDITRPKVTTQSINDLGITELVGRGQSNFAGSPRNRRHNIAVGADTLHGLLIKPDEEFSLVGALGEIDAAHGYLPELVIKGNKTVPEYGGGLCQIGTTAFRVALNTGLPITERRPHSYRVSYYEPAGTDATIYNPSPDLKFINDTGHYLLWQTHIEGNDLIFEFYGTDDGRQVKTTEPTLSNYISPPPTKIIETEDLNPGTRKCTERAHTGATAVFYRTITKPGEEPEKETWTSVYQPWQEVCLIGVESEE
ncbi:MAG: VanW family protein [Patescibacteria group bacterium]|nr:VanW family protein [Patescibacteria group bacterium]